MGGCQNYGRKLGALNIGSRIIVGIQKETIILRATHIRFSCPGLELHISEMLTCLQEKCRDFPKL